jgi:N-dimethylarginine dimethylaminohydrolase
MNILSVNPNTVIVGKDQISLIKVLESKGFTVIPMPMRHARTLSGGFHCATLDLRRKGSLEDYFR